MASNRPADAGLPGFPSKAGLAAKALFLAAACYLAFESFGFSYGLWHRTIDAAAVFAQDPEDPVALSEYVLTKTRTDPYYRLGDTEAKFARGSLRRAPLTAQSLWMIGTRAEEAGDLSVADEAIGLAESVSRHDVVVQLWLIQRSVEKDRVDESIRHYNTALTIEPKLGTMLYPILAKAISYPEVRVALKPYLERKSNWIPEFLDYAARNSSVTDYLDTVSPVLGRLRSADYKAANQVMIARIAKARDGFAAIDYAAKTLPGFDPKAFRLAGFTMHTTDRRMGSLAWSLAQARGIDASVGRKGELLVTMQPGSFGIIAQRNFPIKPAATYLLTMTVSNNGDAAGQGLRWMALCLSESHTSQIVQLDIPWPGEAAKFRGSITVPADCKLLNLRLMADETDSQLPAGLKLTGLDLRLEQ